MDRYATMFNRLDAKNEGAFVPFVMIGDPDIATSEKIITQLIENGADALELGIPFSDPIADGTTIQKASIRALENNVTPDACFALLKRVRANYPDIPMGLLLYSNLVLAKGITQFYSVAADSGVDSILVADVPIREATPFRSAANEHNIKQILIAPPNASEETMQAIGDMSDGYTYLLGRAGVTGAETAATMPTASLISKLKAVNAAPALLGFGISNPEQVKHAIASGAAGAISGSATVNLIAQNLENTSAMLDALGDFVSRMKAGTIK